MRKCTQVAVVFLESHFKGIIYFISFLEWAKSSDENIFEEPGWLLLKIAGYFLVTLEQV